MNTNRRGAKRFLVLAVIGIVLLSTAAWAGLLPNLSVFKTATEVSDEELANIRGRFVSRGKIVYFGIEMHTEWKTAEGRVFTSGVNLDVERGKSTHFRPTISVVRIAKVDKDLDGDKLIDDASEVGTEISEGGLKDTKGVTQVVQITGDTNKVRNNITLSIKTEADPSDGETAATTGHSPQSGPVAASTESGATAVASVDKNSLSVEITIPGQGVAKQSITSLAGLRQNVRVTGDMNNITNKLNLTAQFRPVNSRRVSANIRSALQGIRGLPPAGLH